MHVQRRTPPCWGTARGETPRLLLHPPLDCCQQFPCTQHGDAVHPAGFASAAVQRSGHCSRQDQLWDGAQQHHTAGNGIGLKPRGKFPGQQKVTAHPGRLEGKPPAPQDPQALQPPHYLHPTESWRWWRLYRYKLLMWEMPNHKTAEQEISRVQDGNAARTVLRGGPSLKSRHSVLQGGDPGAKSSPIRTSDLLSGLAWQIEEGGCVLCLQLKMKRDNISRVENYRG